MSNVVNATDEKPGRMRTAARSAGRAMLVTDFGKSQIRFSGKWVIGERGARRAIFTLRLSKRTLAKM